MDEAATEPGQISPWDEAFGNQVYTHIKCIIIYPNVPLAFKLVPHGKKFSISFTKIINTYVLTVTTMTIHINPQVQVIQNTTLPPRYKWCVLSNQN